MRGYGDAISFCGVMCTIFYTGPRNCTDAQPCRQRQAAKALDETVQAQMARVNMGLSPVSMALAAADWAMHLALSPGRQMVLGQRALALAQQA